MGACFGLNAPKDELAAVVAAEEKKRKKANNASGNKEKKSEEDFKQAEHKIRDELAEIRGTLTELEERYRQMVEESPSGPSAINNDLLKIDLKSMLVQIEHNKLRYKQVTHYLEQNLKERGIVHHAAFGADIQLLRAKAVSGAAITHPDDADDIRIEVEDRMAMAAEASDNQSPIALIDRESEDKRLDDRINNDLLAAASRLSSSSPRQLPQRTTLLSQHRPPLSTEKNDIVDSSDELPEMEMEAVHSRYKPQRQQQNSNSSTRIPVRYNPLV